MEQKNTEISYRGLGVSLLWREPYTRVKKHLPSKKSALTITSHKTDAKLKEGIFVGIDIQKLITGKMFPSTMAQVEEEAWVAFMNVVSGFLGKKKDLEYGRLNLVSD
ncbi:hypothetical protein T4A_11063 [Trichinella pseudospiralis]|uniref:Uncharacterized protein n=1 Tax=Trichinella pseudospiralis TaxID=6337 RepID=A0A0V1EK55_TRIPS|nr:hypothetical protein T4A_11063 [Trichinella pseudospiralis]